jgi:hypothetical protein
MRIGRGPANKSCSLGWVCLVKFNFWGAYSNQGSTGSTPPNKGISLNNWVWNSKQKLLLRVGLLGKFLFWGAHSNPGPAGSTPPNGGNSLNNLAGASKQKLLLGWVCIAKLYFGGLTSPCGLQGPPHQMGVLALRIGRGPANKSCSWQCVYKEHFYF